jgi:hypothetical protein
VLTPLLFAGLGERIFGVYQLTQRISQFGGMTSLGASTYLKIRLSELYADESVHERRKAIGECVLQWSVLLPVLLIWLVVIFHVISGRASLTDGQEVAVIVLIFLTPLAQLMSIGNVALFTHHLGYIGVPLWTGITLASSAGAAAAAYFGLGLEGVAVALTAGTLLNGITCQILARNLLPWFGLEWPRFRGFLGSLGKSLGASIASLVYLGLQQFEALVFGLGAGPVSLARLVLTVIGVQCLDLLVRSFIGTAAYAVAPLVRDRATRRLSALRDEAHGNILFLYTLGAPIIIGMTPVAMPYWIANVTLLSPWVAAAVALTAMFRLMAAFDGGLLDQARDFHWKSLAAVATVLVPGTLLGVLLFRDMEPTGWYWALPVSMAACYVLTALRCRRILAVATSWHPVLLPIAIALASAWATSLLIAAGRASLEIVGAAFASSCVGGGLAMLHPRFAAPVKQLSRRLLRAAGKHA